MSAPSPPRDVRCVNFKEDLKNKEKKSEAEAEAEGEGERERERERGKKNIPEVMSVMSAVREQL